MTQLLTDGFQNVSVANTLLTQYLLNKVKIST